MWRWLAHLLRLELYAFARGRGSERRLKLGVGGVSDEDARKQVGEQRAEAAGAGRGTI